MRAIYREELGSDIGRLRVGEVAEAIHEDDQVLIKVAAAAVNCIDLSHLYNTNYCDAFFLKSPYLGFECSGHVVAIGPKVTTCQVGDRVCAFTRGGGSHAEVVAVPEIFVVAAPPGIPLTDAAALPQATCLVLWCLKNISSAKKILIHRGAGDVEGFGCIAIQYAKHIGCEVYATEVNDERVKVCKDLGANVCINSSKEDFCGRLKRETNGLGVDIILDLVGGEYLEKNLACLSIGGSLIYANGGKAVYPNVRTLEEKRISIIGYSLLRVNDVEIKDLLTVAVETVWPLISRGVIKPKIGAVFNFSKAKAAFSAWDSSTIQGKILLAP